MLIYEEQPADMQRLALQQGWATLFAHTVAAPEQPAFALFGSTEDLDGDGGADRKEIVLAIRGTTTLVDIVTDIRTLPQRFPPSFEKIERILSSSKPRMDRQHQCDDPSDVPEEAEDEQWDWDSVPDEAGYACGELTHGKNNIRFVVKLRCFCVSSSRRRRVSGSSLAAGRGRPHTAGHARLGL